jgi:hypothetical protein
MSQQSANQSTHPPGNTEARPSSGRGKRGFPRGSCAGEPIYHTRNCTVTMKLLEEQACLREESQYTGDQQDFKDINPDNQTIAVPIVSK